MMRFLPLILLWFLCGSCAEESAPTDTTPVGTETAATSGPAPGTAPATNIRGDLDFGYATADELASGSGCNILLRPTGMSEAEGTLVGIDLEGGVARVMLDNEMQSLPLVDRTTTGPEQSAVYIFKSGKAKMQVKITDRRGGGGNSGYTVTGDVNLATAGGELTANVTGQSGC